MRSNETNSTNTLIVKSFENKSSQTVTDSKINSVDEKTASDKLIGNMEISSRWVCQTDPETKRVTYIDTITGNSSFFMPEQKELDETKESVSGHFEKGHFFLSHDFSPFMPKKSSPSLTEDVSMSHLQTELTDFVENKEKKEWNCKWRDNKQESSSSDSNVEEMFNKWENPIFNISSEANCTEDASVSQKVPQMYGILNSYRFSKSTLQTLQVIGQVDCKFIACVLQDFNNGCNDQMLLALFDQHAVHERIRLEELSEELYETAENGERRIKSVPITPSLRITLESEEVRLLHAYHIHLQQIGVRLSLNNDSNVIDVYSIPAIFIEKETKELRKKLPEVS
ncbi:DNA mismatch repair protein Mlh3, partial [Stegodyphus mimosarum]